MRGYPAPLQTGIPSPWGPPPGELRDAQDPDRGEIPERSQLACKCCACARSRNTRSPGEPPVRDVPPGGPRRAEGQRGGRRLTGAGGSGSVSDPGASFGPVRPVRPVRAGATRTPVRLVRRWNPGGAHCCVRAGCPRRSFGCPDTVCSAAPPAASGLRGHWPGRASAGASGHPGGYVWPRPTGPGGAGTSRCAAPGRAPRPSAGGWRG